MDIGYIRVSKRDQNVDNQYNILIKQGILPQDIYCDVGVSGAVTASERPQYSRMMNFMQTHKVDRLFVFEITRIGRSFIDTLNIIIDLEKKGTTVVSLSPAEAWSTQTDPSFRNFILSILAWVAERERTNLIERVRAGQERAREEGKHIGRPRRGYEVNPEKRKPKIDWKKVDGYLDKGMSLSSISRLMDIPYTTLIHNNKRRKGE